MYITTHYYIQSRIYWACHTLSVWHRNIYKIIFLENVYILTACIQHYRIRMSYAVRRTSNSTFSHTVFCIFIYSIVSFCARTVLISFIQLARFTHFVWHSNTYIYIQKACHTHTVWLSNIYTDQKTWYWHVYNTLIYALITKYTLYVIRTSYDIKVYIYVIRIYSYTNVRIQNYTLWNSI